MMKSELSQNTFRLDYAVGVTSDIEMFLDQKVLYNAQHS